VAAILVAASLLPPTGDAQMPRDSLFAAVDRARADAETADAAVLAAEEFADAMSEYADVLRNFEKGRDIDRITRGAEMAETLFRHAELNAIRARHLGVPRNALALARAERTERTAPRTTARAEELLAQADAALVTDRYDTEPAIALARAAESEARHAMYIGTVVERVRDKDLTTEDLIMEWESALRAMADALQFEADLSAGPGATRDAVVGYARELAELRETLAGQKLHIAGLEEEIRELDARLGGAAADRDALIRTVERQARIREQFAQVENMFAPDEAVVLRDGDELIIRLVGLRFASNSARLDPAFDPLMAKVDAAITVFPQCRVAVEGHTDAQGDIAGNQRLSEERARAVMDYMTGPLRIPPFRVRATGYGDSRPIASNRTEEGRARNRRIDLVITPDPGSLY
jgi:outer membrane protein OmpA-like peptidoglycan-associated protein